MPRPVCICGPPLLSFCVGPTERSTHGPRNRFVATFVLPDCQPRWLDFLSKPKRRSSFLHRLADDRDFDSRLRVPIPPSYQTPESVAAQLQKLHAPTACHLISEQTELDGRDMDLLAALELVIGSGLGTVISCIPGKLAYYEGEMPGDRYVLHRKT